MSFAFDPSEPVARNLARIGGELLGAARAAAQDGNLAPGERVRRARTACKKLRGLLRLVKPGFPRMREENAAIRAAARSLASARDAEALTATLASLLDAGTAFSRAEADHLRAVIGETAMTGTGPATESSSLEAFATAIAPIADRAAHWGDDPIGWDDIVAGAAGTAGRARRAMRTAAGSRIAADLHEWRKQTKYHWYHLRLLRRFDRHAFGPERDRVKHTALLLGQHHDLAVLTERALAALPTEPDLLARLCERIARRQDALAHDALLLGRDAFSRSAPEWRRLLRSRIRHGVEAAAKAEAPA